MNNLALCELLNRDIASLVEVNFGITLMSLVLIAFIFFLVELELLLS